MVQSFPLMNHGVYKHFVIPDIFYALCFAEVDKHFEKFYYPLFKGNFNISLNSYDYLYYGVADYKISIFFAFH